MLTAELSNSIVVLSVVEQLTTHKQKNLKGHVLGSRFEKIEKQNVGNEVYKQMMEKIINNVWEPGSKIPSENELCTNLGVSRHTVRAALNKLNALGLLETKHGEGTFVKKLEPSLYLNSLVPVVFFGKHEYRTIMEFRKGIEVEATWLAAKNATEENIAELQHIVDELIKNKDDIESYAEFDIDFHVAISKASKNPMFSQTMNIIKAILSAQLQENMNSHGNNLGFKFHLEILDAIKNRDSETASSCMSRHLSLVIDKLE